MDISTFAMSPTIDISASAPHVISERKLYCQSLRRHPGVAASILVAL
jgi:hypothetical protein